MLTSMVFLWVPVFTRVTRAEKVKNKKTGKCINYALARLSKNCKAVFCHLELDSGSRGITTNRNKPLYLSLKPHQYNKPFVIPHLMRNPVKEDERIALHPPFNKNLLYIFFCHSGLDSESRNTPDLYK